MNFKSFPEINTTRLFLRRLQDSDGDVILFLQSDAAVTNFIERPDHRKVKNLSDAVSFINSLNSYFETNKSISWGITIKDQTSVIGTICLWNFSLDYKTAEVGYDLHTKHQNKGVMSEALKAIVDFGFRELKLDKIEAFTHSKNENSIKLLLKNGFSLNGNRSDIANKSNIVFETVSANKI
ncbi:MAG: ribosomal-protein-alanine N-acetyltransferase [Saprospiraceae bacterium]|jgi:ribosomal-protein-alanine N-acetyltransferase